MVVLGIDPGYALMGWGVVEAQGARMRLLGYGCVETQAGVPMQHRLRALQLGVRDLVNIYHPDDVAFEELFFSKKHHDRHGGQHGARRCFGDGGGADGQSL